MVARRDECKGWWKGVVSARGDGEGMSARGGSKKGWCKGV